MKPEHHGADASPEIARALREPLRRPRGTHTAHPAHQADPHRQTVRDIVERLKDVPGALLPILHAVQDALGHVPADAVADIAQGLDLSRAEVHGVITYYPHFRSAPAGRRVLQICRAEACQAMGAEPLWAQACARLGLPDAGGTARDGAFTLESVYCLGLCATSPALRLDEHVHARLTPARLDALLAASEAAA
ncbi:formate dehydrogenase subunit gamma [Verminephrobacter aporrectodeae subsp. tuberculatae]|uniref:Formate dehydrogenase subunit gamma n=1 Tax=Verminephrobacter aporrectodeae subsp. tuberculatae TaxID=1110392 RepID=A0ABT3KVT5_9BURK|nr:formate dehydrogenase subunit gamma [Verminephrobacter aporrectodeae]MCW5258408.1 formate dehydrogenase subunit gamma [Verminephrobacter aporrectodeae subsp. tuberculatae]MCW5322467.1 formate dehydrogenase subunit gamma [Verminephrobacter aporrectodeae subsp. tuberculatae]